MNLEKSVFNISPGNFKESIKVPYSKSYANRLLILGALSKEVFTIKNIAMSTDVNAMLDCLRAVGLDIDVNYDQETIVLNNSFPDCETKQEGPVRIKTGDGGTTNRLLVSLLALGNNTYHLISSEHFKDRPNQEAFRIFRELKVDTQYPQRKDEFWISVRGPADFNKNVKVDCAETTQFYSSFKLLSANTTLGVSARNLKTSLFYAKMTDDLVRQFRGGARSFTIPIDFSSASYPIAFGSLIHDLKITNCESIESLQADSILIDLINNHGGDISIGVEGLRVKKSTLSPFDQDCSNCPDLVPTLVFLALGISGTSYMRNIKILKFKESDRIGWLVQILEKIGAQYEYNEDQDYLSVSGVFSNNKKTYFTLPSDHRMIMLASMIIRAGKVGGSVNNVSHVNKSYPSFFDHLVRED